MLFYDRPIHLYTKKCRAPARSGSSTQVTAPSSSSRVWTASRAGSRRKQLISASLELLRRYRHVAVGKLGKAEVDFVAMGDDGPRYLQVAQSILDEKTRERELAPLEKIANNYPKTVLSLDWIGTGDIGSLIATGRHARCVRTL